MAGFFESLFPGALAGYGYGQMYSDLKDDRSDLQGFFGDLSNEVGSTLNFTPWTVRSAMGTTASDASGNMNFEMSTPYQGIQDQMFGQGQSMLSRASQDPTGREQEVYDRIRTMQRPEEERAYHSMNQGLFNRGRSGMASAQYGGTPEQLAFAKARGEAQNQASVMAMDQAQKELMNQYQMGSGMLQEGYRPMTTLMAQTPYGLNNAQLRDQMNLNRGSLMAQLGLGQVGSDINYGNIQGNAFGNMISALAELAGGAGSVVDDQGFGGLWDLITSAF